MPIRESSFRIGCGRYVQEEGALLTKGWQEIRRLGTAPLIISDETAFGIAGEMLIKSMTMEREACEKYEVVIHRGACCEEQAKGIAAVKEAKGYDVIVGVGGGVIMDFAKLSGHFAKCPVLNIPTSSATCAAYTPLSVCYTPEGRTVGSYHMEHEVDGVLVDTGIIAKQPVRLFLAGVFDALAKFVEIKQRFREAECPLGLDYAYLLSERTYDVLNRDLEGCLSDMSEGVLTPRLENAVFATIAATGVISGIARGSNQCALAHKFYEITRLLFQETAKPYLHGEIVGVGLLLQNYFNGEAENNIPLLELMKRYGMPSKVTDVGVDPAENYFERYYELLCASSAIDERNANECRKLREAMEYLWGLS